MYDIEMHEASKEFTRCWQAAGRHLQSMAKDVTLNWLKANLTPPILEHLSFQIGNQNFFIRIRPVGRNIESPGNSVGFRKIAAGWKGIACLMPMVYEGNQWKPSVSGWGLINAETNERLDPIDYVSDEKIEITDWELHDFAVQIVREHIVNDLGFELMSSQGCPDVDPSIWFVGEHGPEWVVVRGVRCPELEASMPDNIKDITESCARLSKTGHFASVSFANQEDAFDSSGEIPALPIWRGHGAHIRFEGLVPIGLH